MLGLSIGFSHGHFQRFTNGSAAALGTGACLLCIVWYRLRRNTCASCMHCWPCPGLVLLPSPPLLAASIDSVGRPAFSEKQCHAHSYSTHLLATA